MYNGWFEIDVSLSKFSGRFNNSLWIAIFAPWLGSKRSQSSGFLEWLAIESFLLYTMA
jgi:hypothetical protein